MKIKFPRNVVVDTDNIPQDFEEQIRASFEAYTEGTAEAYTYQDKLAYIDVCRKLLHRAADTSDCVLALMKEYLEYEVTEQGEIPDKEDYLSVEFMETCYESGRTNLYDHYTGNHHIDDKIMDLLVRAIKVVINYERMTDKQPVLCPYCGHEMVKGDYIDPKCYSCPNCEAESPAVPMGLRGEERDWESAYAAAMRRDDESSYSQVKKPCSATATAICTRFLQKSVK